MNGDFHTISPSGNVTKTQFLDLSNVTSRAVTIGIGNITGVDTAVALRGWGSNFWMRVTIAALCFLVIVGGVKRIGAVASKIVPFMRAGVSPFPDPKTSPDAVLFLI